MKCVPLTYRGQALYALVDDEDYLWLMNGNRWRAINRRGILYAVRNLRRDTTSGKRGVESMHRVIMGFGSDDKREVDHVNHDGLDNRRDNLREANRIQNCRNTRRSTRNQSGYIGVSFDKTAGKFVARIKHGTERRFVGCYDTPEEAARARDEMAREYFKEFAVLNFGDDDRG